MGGSGTSFLLRMRAFVGIRLLLRLAGRGLSLLRRRRVNPVGGLIHVQFARNLIRGRLELLDSFAQTTGNLWNTLGTKNQKDGQEYEYEFERSQASHNSAGWNRSIVRSVSEHTTIRLFSGSSASSDNNGWGAVWGMPIFDS